MLKSTLGQEYALTCSACRPLFWNELGTKLKKENKKVRRLKSKKIITKEEKRNLDIIFSDIQVKIARYRKSDLIMASFRRWYDFANPDTAMLPSERNRLKSLEREIDGWCLFIKERIDFLEGKTSAEYTTSTFALLSTKDAQGEEDAVPPVQFDDLSNTDEIMERVNKCLSFCRDMAKFSYNKEEVLRYIEDARNAIDSIYDPAVDQSRFLNSAYCNLYEITRLTSGRNEAFRIITEGINRMKNINSSDKFYNVRLAELICRRAFSACVSGYAPAYHSIDGYDVEDAVSDLEQAVKLITPPQDGQLTTIIQLRVSWSVNFVMSCALYRLYEYDRALEHAEAALKEAERISSKRAGTKALRMSVAIAMKMRCLYALGRVSEAIDLAKRGNDRMIEVIAISEECARLFAKCCYINIALSEIYCNKNERALAESAAEDAILYVCQSHVASFVPEILYGDEYDALYNMMELINRKTH